MWSSMFILTERKKLFIGLTCSVVCMICFSVWLATFTFQCVLSLEKSQWLNWTTSAPRDNAYEPYVLTSCCQSNKLLLRKKPLLLNIYNLVMPFYGVIFRSQNLFYYYYICLHVGIKTLDRIFTFHRASSITIYVIVLFLDGMPAILCRINYLYDFTT